MHIIKNISAEYAQSRFVYDSDTGKLFWKSRNDLGRFSASWNARNAGQVAGHDLKTHICVVLDGKSYPAHHIAWLLYYGTHANSMIDHINGDGLDNRISNLRIATAQQNQQNRKVRVDSTTGYKGVRVGHVRKKDGVQTYRAVIRTPGGENLSWSFDTAEEAAAAYQEAARLYFGEFAPDTKRQVLN